MKQSPPPPTTCPKCGREEASIACSLCKFVKVAAFRHAGDRAVAIAAIILALAYVAVDYNDRHTEAQIAAEVQP